MHDQGLDIFWRSTSVALFHISTEDAIFLFLNIFCSCSLNIESNVLVSVSTLDKEIKTKKANIEAATEVGTAIAKKALAKKIENVVFDRGGYIYHGVVKAVAEAAREAGLKF